MNNLGGKILGLLVSIGLIIGGLSGEMVLRGTDSSGALVAVGFLFLIYDIYLLATHNKVKEQQEAEVDERMKEIFRQEAIRLQTTERLPSASKIVITRPKLLRNGSIHNNRRINVYLNGKDVGSLVAGESLQMLTDVAENNLMTSDSQKPPMLYRAQPGGEEHFAINGQTGTFEISYVPTPAPIAMA